MVFDLPSSGDQVLIVRCESDRRNLVIMSSLDFSAELAGAHGPQSDRSIVMCRGKQVLLQRHVHIVA